ncbi:MULTISPECIES: caspase family protein [Bradyrhizobium]|uniref:caspase family protein n=1 Tax=Bradyrhizobium TaxID=374 RepID=UPI00155F42A6|nr:MULTISPECIES: caspase family protein [Bradyrhizobium]MDD1519441.1 peptidase C14, caspase catalytic subunit p20 [Bradyrhizobium sp. WBAH30]MDD1543685.1 peptidase C14, caspase catalytic subunit p20 [Bradyrhizobium sp. WBAH41]MDD1558030.1 peptidase C14, caspase catalytic subunit p20 [Bradyrhizobium sp. WBAH23]MDD1565442.1 peptidase C14, caspase catalytic subunit p20 [Bradyrhizobium sp. WBAH33]MDD1592736.1 peptidase C14, caspase catalytic subunit p20 [Bradyrhizobium sp. WBAH42]
MRITALAMILAATIIVPVASAVCAAPQTRKPVADSAPRIALVIGNARYAKLGTLANPVNDAQLMAERLRQTGFDVTLVADRDLKSLSQDVEEFAQKVKARGPSTVAVLYYAGHGVESDGVNYLVPVNADIKRRADIVPQSLPVKRLADRLAASGNALNILIVDACRDNPFPPGVSGSATLGLVPMGAVFGVFIASATGSGKVAFDGEDGHSPYTKALADAITVPGERLEDVFKSVRRQVRLSTGEQQIPWESTSLELDFFFVPPPPPPSQAAQLLTAAKETGNVALYDLLIDRFPASPEANDARAAAAELRKGTAAKAPAAASSASLVLDRARQTRTPEAYDLVAALFPDTPEADEARAAASRLREITVLDSAGPTYEGRELVQLIQAQLVRLDCFGGEQGGIFDAATIQGLRRASQLSDEHFLWYRPTMAALRALKKVDGKDGCAGRKTVAAPRCLRVNNEDFCQ